MVTLSINSSDLRKLQRDLDRIQAKLPQAIARGMNEGGDRVRTQVQRTIQKQTSLVRYSSVTKRVRTARAFPGGLSYQIVVAGKPPTKPDEFRTRVTKGPGGGVTISMWGVAHKFKRSFRQKYKLGLRAAWRGPRQDTRFRWAEPGERGSQGSVGRGFLPHDGRSCRADRREAFAAGAQQMIQSSANRARAGPTGPGATQTEV